MLGRGIERPVRHGQESEHRAHVDDAAASLLPHVGKDGARHADEAEEVGLENGPGLFDRAFFGTAWRHTEAGVVHEQIDAALAPHHFAHEGCHRRVAGHVQGQHLERLPAGLGSASARAVDLVAGSREPLRTGFADARRGARDERDLSCDLSHVILLKTRDGSARSTGRDRRHGSFIYDGRHTCIYDDHHV